MRRRERSSKERERGKEREEGREIRGKEWRQRKRKGGEEKKAEEGWHK